jgi:hypothetical protein
LKCSKNNGKQTTLGQILCYKVKAHGYQAQIVIFFPLTIHVGYHEKSKGGRDVGEKQNT